MIFDFKPWQLDIDIEKTKQFYQEVDCAKDIKANEEFIETLSPTQKQFFNDLGVDLTKIEVETKLYDIPEEDGIPAAKIYKMSINFLMKGKLLALPKYQKEIYSDEDVFGDSFPTSIKVISSIDDDFSEGIIFKHPCFHYDDDIFKTWDCGYVLGSILLMKEL